MRTDGCAWRGAGSRLCRFPNSVTARDFGRLGADSCAILAIESGLRGGAEDLGVLRDESACRPIRLEPGKPAPVAVPLHRRRVLYQPLGGHGLGGRAPAAWPRDSTADLLECPHLHWTLGEIAYCTACITTFSVVALLALVSIICTLCNCWEAGGFKRANSGGHHRFADRPLPPALADGPRSPPRGWTCDWR
jgi:hypothetical protein